MEANFDNLTIFHIKSSFFSGGGRMGVQLTFVNNSFQGKYFNNVGEFVNKC